GRRAAARLRQARRTRSRGRDMTVQVILGCVALLLGTAVVAVPASRGAVGRPLVYGLSLALCLAGLAAALAQLLGGGGASTVRLPLGLPWLGAHFRVDA